MPQDKYTDSELFNLVGGSNESIYELWKSIYPDMGGVNEFLEFLRPSSELESQVNQLSNGINELKSGKLDTDKLTDAINTALTQAKKKRRI